jgi:predicted acetyltransferase
MSGVSLTTRQLQSDDAAAARRLGAEAFGVPRTPPTAPATVDQPGMTWFGAFSGPELVARMIDREYDSWFGGVAVPTSGIAGVTVAAEHRGQGALGPLFAETLRHARSRGALISTLFPTAPGIYRRFGYELVADYVTVEVPTQSLAAVARPLSVTSRRATADDFDQIRAVYDAWASEQNGPLTRRGVSFTAGADDFIASFTGVTVAVDADSSVSGFVSWDRGQGYGEGSSIEVSDLLATGPEAYRALLRTIGSFASVTPTTKIDTSGDDLALLLLPSFSWRVAHSSPYMLKILDVPGAVSIRRYAAGLRASLRFALAGDVLPEIDGAYELVVESGTAQCRAVNQADRILSSRGLALLYAGAQSCANLRASGHLSGGDPAEDLEWDTLFGGRQVHIRDYF